MSPTRAHPDDRLEAFGAPAQSWRPPMPTREKLLVVVLALLVVFIGWGLGGIRIWSQVVMGSLGLLAFVVAFAPGPDLRRVPWAEQPLRRLLVFPVFWLGGLFVLYVLVQQLNPSWEYVREGTRWQLMRLEHIAWLPSGMRTPFETMSGWRCLIWVGGTWLAVCAAWAGLQFRRSAVILMWAAAGSATVMCFVGITFKLSRTRELLGFIDARGARSFFGTFYYANHAGAFLMLQLGLTLALALYSWHRGVLRGAKSNPGVFLVMLALVILTGIYFAESRASLLFSFGLCGVAAVSFLVAFGRQRQLGRGRIVLGSILIGMLTLFGVLVLGQADLERINQRVFNVARSVMDLSREEEEREFRDSSVEARLKFARPTLDMWAERKTYGFGLGSYQFYIPVHQRNYPDIYLHPWNNRSDAWKERRGFRTDIPLVRRLRFAHTDWLQSLAEVGIAGTAVLMAILLYWWGVLLRALPRWNPGVPVCVAAFIFVFVYAAFEFVFWSPSVYMAFALMPVLALKTLGRKPGGA